jgi:hypothetical protein
MHRPLGFRVDQPENTSRHNQKQRPPLRACLPDCRTQSYRDDIQLVEEHGCGRTCQRRGGYKVLKGESLSAYRHCSAPCKPETKRGLPRQPRVFGERQTDTGEWRQQGS